MMEGRGDDWRGAREGGEEQMRGNEEWRRELTDGRIGRKLKKKEEIK